MIKTNKSKKIRKQCPTCGITIVDPPTSLIQHKAEVHKDPTAIEIQKDLETL